MNIQQMMKQAQEMQERLQRELGHHRGGGDGGRGAWSPSSWTAASRSSGW